MMDFVWTLETPTIGWIINRVIPDSPEHKTLAGVVIIACMIIYYLWTRRCKCGG